MWMKWGNFEGSRRKKTNESVRPIVAITIWTVLTRSVVRDNIPVTLVGLQLHSEATRITGGVRGTRLATDGGETGGDGARVADLAEQ